MRLGPNHPRTNAVDVESFPAPVVNDIMEISLRLALCYYNQDLH